MMCRPRKQSSPSSSSRGWERSAARGHSRFVPSAWTLKAFTCVPGIAQPTEPQMWRSSVLHVLTCTPAGSRAKHAAYGYVGKT